MTRIHILQGRGSNCTCGDCAVLYGGKCFTTRENNMLDKLEDRVLEYLTKTPGGKIREKVTGPMYNRCIEEVVRPAIQKFLKIEKHVFYRRYYSFVPLVFMMTTPHRESAVYAYRKGRSLLFWSIEKELKEAATEVDHDD